MTRKSDIMSLLKTELERINGGTDSRVAIPGTPYTFKTTVNKVTKHFLYLEQLNDRIELCFTPSTEIREYFGAGLIYSTIDVHIRGYLQTGDNFDEPDNLLEDIEFIINGFRFLRQYDIEDARILGIVTDEGVFEPNRIVDIRINIKYQVDPVI